MMPPRLLAIGLLLCSCAAAEAQKPASGTQRGDRMLAEYFAAETKTLADDSLAEVQSLEDWQARKDTYRQELLEMLGLDPLPERTDLNAEIVGVIERDNFLVERIQFQSRPGLYVTGNLYRPKQVDQPLPAILYVCGHGRVAKDGISFGNKTHYQHHGSWFAQNGYVCLTIDTLQLGEIEGIHHGTHRYGMWWWLNRGYTPAGVEAWNCVRALDYLQSRPEVDGERIGVTGRSGGGAYSWWIGAIDDRIQCAVPVAGITDLTNHVVDGCVEGHCDCMFMVNTYRWDYDKVAALIAPRPLLISNTDTDRIFPLDGVYRTFERVRRIYRLHGAADKVALNITAGGHMDTQELRVHAFRWLNQHLKQDNGLVETMAVERFAPEELKVFAELPADQLNTEIHETFVAAAEPPAVPQDSDAWQRQRDQWLEALREKVFRGWPESQEDLSLERAFTAEHEGVQLEAWDFTSQGPIRLRLYLARRAGAERPDLTVLNVLDDAGWKQFLATMHPGFEEQLKDESLPEADADAFEQTRKMFEANNWAMAYVAPRGVGPTAWDASERAQTQVRRRFYLLGQTLDSMQAYDVRRAIQAIGGHQTVGQSPLWLQSEGAMAGVALYASLFETGVKRLDLHNLPSSHRDGPYFLNVSRVLDMPQALGLAAEKARVVVYQDGQQGWDWTRQLIEQQGWDAKQLQIREPTTKQ